MPFLTVFLRSMTRHIDKKLMDNLVGFFKYEIDESNFAIAMIFIHLTTCIIIKYNVKITPSALPRLKTYTIYKLKVNE